MVPSPGHERGGGTVPGERRRDRGRVRGSLPGGEPATGVASELPSLWSFLDEASDHEGVQICLDLSHVLQFERNVHGRSPVLPRSFPWERVAEIHLAGYVRAEYGGRTVYLDQHLADIPAEEYRLLSQVVELRGTQTPLGICLEMEPREPGLSWPPSTTFTRRSARRPNEVELVVAGRSIIRQP